jgi:hypothetical protein
VPGDRARLVSPMYFSTNSQGDCFKFWYHMYGNSIGVLNIWLKQNNQLTKILWNRSTNLGDFWRYGHVTIKSSSEFQIVLEGIVGNSPFGY